MPLLYFAASQAFGHGVLPRCALRSVLRTLSIARASAAILKEAASVHRPDTFLASAEHSGGSYRGYLPVTAGKRQSAVTTTRNTQIEAITAAAQAYSRASIRRIINFGSKFRAARIAYKPQYIFANSQPLNRIYFCLMRECIFCVRICSKQFVRNRIFQRTHNSFIF